MKPNRAICLAGACLALIVNATISAAQSRGEDVFRRCMVCHSVVAPSGEMLAGRGATSGPNLYNIVGMRAASVSGYRYSESLRALGRVGVVWSEASLQAYLRDPVGFSRSITGDNAARSNMSFVLTDAQEAAAVIAYLRELSR